MKELEKFYHSSNAYETMLLEQTKNVYREYLDFIKEHVPAGLHILDAGCGIGYSTNHLAKKYKVIGSDFSQKFIKTAQKTYPKIKFFQDDLQKLRYKSGFFDAVCSNNVIEHINQPGKAIKEMVRVTKKGGFIVIYAPNLLSPIHPLKWLMSRQNKTYDGPKTRPGLIKMMLRNWYWLVLKSRKINQKLLRKIVILNDFFPDQDAVFYCNPIDIQAILIKHKLKIISYQSLGHLKKNKIAWLFFKIFPNVSGSTRIVAQKR